ncbi:MAG: methylated-DNA--[protein]-cysteine S-methyltransferase [Hyphomicrobiales bacterium]
MAVTAPAPGPANDNAQDYNHIRNVISYLSENWREQPSLDELAHFAQLSPAHLQKIFTRWAGVSPKGFLQALTLDHARELLRDSASVLDTAFEVGMSGPGRLHDLFVTHEAMTPGDYKAKGAGLEMAYGFHPCPFGTVMLVATDRGLAGLGFADEGNESNALEDMMARWPAARFISAPEKTAPYAERIFNPERWSKSDPLRVVLIGSEFQVDVWRTLLRIPAGKATTYSDIATHIGKKPGAARAVGTAVGMNPFSFVVPCHRVFGKSGAMCGYHWGITRKRAILGWEAGLLEN